MPDSRFSHHAGETVVRSRPREPDRREVARELFAEHLDLDAIRRALGQRAAPVVGGGARDGRGAGGAGTAPDGPPLGRDLSLAPRLEAPRDVALAAPAGGARPVSRRVTIHAPALLGGIVAVAIMLEIGAFGIPSLPGRDGSRANPPAAPIQTAPPPAHVVSLMPELGLKKTLAPVLSGDTIQLSPVPVIRARAAADALPVPVQPAVPPASAPTPRVLPLLGGMDLGPGDMAHRPDLAPIRFTAPADSPPAAPPVPRLLSEIRSAAAPVLARATMDDRTATPIGKRPAESTMASDPRTSVPWKNRAVVHLHRAADGTFRARLTKALRSSGFDRIEWRAVADTVSQTQARYFHPGDARASERAAAALAAQGRPAGVRDFTHYNPPARQGTIEIWLSD